MDENKYFDKHWNLYNHKIPNEKVKVAKDFLSPIISEIKINKNPSTIKILDVGCGDGVHYQVIDELGSDISFTGIDISDEVIKNLTTIHQKKTNVFFNAGDALKLPYDDSSFDYVFSFGVLGYTPDPYLGFKEKARVLKSGGKLGVWLYPKKTGLSGLIFNIVRLITTKSPHFVKARIADLIVPFLYFLPTRSGLNLSNASYAQCREVVMVNIAPDELVFFNKTEITKWFLENNFKIDFDDSDNLITLWGTKL